jgi:hypothetical protein
MMSGFYQKEAVCQANFWRPSGHIMGTLSPFPFQVFRDNLAAREVEPVTLYDWAMLISAIILVALGGLLVFQFGYARGRRAAEKEAERAQAESIFPAARILPPPERPS